MGRPIEKHRRHPRLERGGKHLVDPTRVVAEDPVDATSDQLSDIRLPQLCIVVRVADGQQVTEVVGRRGGALENLRDDR